jgi:LacI family transcriptional regulator
MGISVPRDISITGYDDIPLATLVEPQITTVSLPIAVMGHQAATKLLFGQAKAKPEGTYYGSQDVFSTSLVVRSSTGPVLLDGHEVKFENAYVID